jgi:hypothetical protein
MGNNMAAKAVKAKNAVPNPKSQRSEDFMNVNILRDLRMFAAFKLAFGISRWVRADMELQIS